MQQMLATAEALLLSADSHLKVGWAGCRALQGLQSDKVPLYLQANTTGCKNRLVSFVLSC